MVTFVFFSSLPLVAMVAWKTGYDVTVPYFVNDLLFSLEIPKSDGLTSRHRFGLRANEQEPPYI